LFITVFLLWANAMFEEVSKTKYIMSKSLLKRRVIIMEYIGNYQIRFNVVVFKYSSKITYIQALHFSSGKSKSGNSIYLTFIKSKT